MRRALLGLLLLFGCAMPGWAQSGNPAHDRLAAMTTQQQREALPVLLGGLRDSCPSLSGSYFAGLDASLVAYWDLRCDNGSAWRVALPANGAAADVTPCAAQFDSCFLPAARVAGDNGPIRRARCSAACELQSGAARQACVARCLRGSEAVASVGGPGADRHLAIVVADLPLMAEGFLGSGPTSDAAIEAARGVCVAMAGQSGCRIAAMALNQCLALAQSAEGDVASGRGIERDDAETEARQACGSATGCQIILSGC